jgi:hypothetical protein
MLSRGIALRSTVTGWRVVALAAATGCTVPSLPAGPDASATDGAQDGDASSSTDSGLGDASPPVDSGGTDSPAQAPDATDGGPNGDAEHPGDATTDSRAGATVDGDSAADAASPPCPYSDWVDGACASVCGSGDFGDGGLVDGAPFGYNGGPGLPYVVQSLSVYGGFNFVCGVSASGAVLHRLWASNGTTSGWALELSIPDPAVPSSYFTYTVFDPTQPDAAALSLQNNAALTLDGTTLIVDKPNNDGFQVASLAGNRMGTLDAGPFTAFNQSVPPGTNVGFPVISGDGLTLYFTQLTPPDETPAGIYATTRTDTSQPFATFPQSQLLQGNVQVMWLMTGISSDGLTAFFQGPNWILHVVSRPNARAAWISPEVMPDGSVVGGVQFNLAGHPTADCRYVFTDCNPGGGAAYTAVCQLPLLH